jgi:hypothetical protein
MNNERIMKHRKVAKNARNNKINKKALDTNKKALYKESFLPQTSRLYDVSLLDLAHEWYNDRRTLSTNLFWWTRRELNSLSLGAKSDSSTKSGPASLVKVAEIALGEKIGVSNKARIG